MDRLRKCLSILLIITFIIPNTSFMFAAPGDDPIMMNGVITWETEGKAATSNIYYRTIGWTVYKEKISSGNISTSEKPYGRFYMQQSDEYPSYNRPGYLITEFECSAEDVIKGLNKAKDKDGQILDWKNGETVYLSAIMEVRRGDGKGGYKVLGTYTDLSRIKASQPWSNPGDFDQYYNKRLKLDFLPDDIHKKVKVNGELISDTVVDSGYAGEQKLVIFDEKITHNGREYILDKTAIELRAQLGRVFGEFSVAKHGIDQVSKRYVPIFLEGTNVYGNYIANDLNVTVQHYDLDTGKSLKTDEKYTVEFQESITEESEKFQDKVYVYAELSEDGGKTWKERTSSASVKKTITKDTIVRFYYSGKKSKLIADLSLSASPSAIKDGTTSTVKFTLNASGSTGDYKITEYEFLFSDSSNFTNAKRISSKTPVVDVTETGVEPGSRWYGKVTVTDEKGNTADATDNLTIGVLQDIKVFAGINSISVDNNSKANINDYDNSYQIADYITRTEIDTSGTSHNDLKKYNVYLKKDMALIKDLNENHSAEMFYSISINSSKSWSTNGIGTYDYKFGGSSGSIGEYSAKTSSSKIEDLDGDLIRLDYSSLQYIYIQKQTVEVPIILTVNDRKYPSETDTTESVYICFKVDDSEKMEPSVSLGINKNTFTSNEVIEFSPEFVENSDTYPILRKKWTITDSDNVIVDEGEGEIPRNYPNKLKIDRYTAHQYIYYNKNTVEVERYAKVNFEIVNLLDPDVAISSDKDKYYVPTNAYFEVESTDGDVERYPIDSKEWKLTTKDGIVIAEGKEEFPDIYDLGLDAMPGYYIAHQKIYWFDESNTLKDKVATCEFKVISPKSAAALDISMKTNTDWQTVDQDNPGKQFKQIRIDLSRSGELNFELENTYPLDWSTTQISIIPKEGQSTNSIHTYLESDRVFNNDSVSIYGQKYIDVRFDEYGIYKISGTVSNIFYGGVPTTMTIEIREDLPPKISLGFEELVDQDNLTTYRNSNGLHVKFKVNIISEAQDEDEIDYDSAKLKVSFDKNGDNILDNKDGNYYEMAYTKNYNTLPNNFEIKENAGYMIDFFDGLDAVLGKIQFDALIGEIPFYPDYVGGNLPSIPDRLGNTYKIGEAEKTVYVDNNEGVVTLNMEKVSKFEADIYNPSGTHLPYDVKALLSYYDKLNLFYMDGEGKKITVNTGDEIVTKSPTNDSQLQGDGTKENPYLISTDDEFFEINKYTSDTKLTYFKQVNDFTISSKYGKDESDSGSSFIFSGPKWQNVIYNGDNHTINIFHKLRIIDVTDKNSILENVTFNADYPGDLYETTFMGNPVILIRQHYGTIRNVKIKGSITVEWNYGLIEYISQTIENREFSESEYKWNIFEFVSQNLGTIRRCQLNVAVASHSIGVIEDCSVTPSTVIDYKKIKDGATIGWAGADRLLMSNSFNATQMVNGVTQFMGGPSYGEVPSFDNVYYISDRAFEKYYYKQNENNNSALPRPPEYPGTTKLILNQMKKKEFADTLNNGRTTPVWEYISEYPTIIPYMALDISTDRKNIGDNTNFKIDISLYSSGNESRSDRLEVLANDKVIHTINYVPGIQTISVPSDGLSGDVKLKVKVYNSNGTLVTTSNEIIINKLNVLSNILNLYNDKNGLDKVVIFSDDGRYYDDNSKNQALVNEIKKQEKGIYLVGLKSNIFEPLKQGINNTSYEQTTTTKIITYINSLDWTSVQDAVYGFWPDHYEEIKYYDKFYDVERDYENINLANKLLDNTQLTEKLKKHKTAKVRIRYTHDPTVYDNSVAVSGLSGTWYDVSVKWNDEKSMWELYDTNGNLFSIPKDHLRGKWNIELEVYDSTGKTVFDKASTDTASFRVHKAPIPIMNVSYNGTIINFNASKSYDVDYQYSKNTRKNIEADREINGIKEFYWSIQVNGEWIDLGKGMTTSYNNISGNEITDYRLTVEDYDGAFSSTSLKSPIIANPDAEFYYHLGTTNGPISNYFYQGNINHETVTVNDSEVSWNDDAYDPVLYAGMAGVTGTQVQKWSNEKLNTSTNTYITYNSWLKSKFNSMIVNDTYIRTTLSVTNKFGKTGTTTKSIVKHPIAMSVATEGFKVGESGKFIGTLTGDVVDLNDLEVKFSATELGISNLVLDSNNMIYSYDTKLQDIEALWNSINYTFDIYSKRTGEKLNTISGKVIIDTPLTLEGFINGEDGENKDIEINTDEEFISSAITNKYAKTVTVKFPVDVIDSFTGTVHAANSEILLYDVDGNHIDWNRDFIISSDTVLDDVELEAVYTARAYNYDEINNIGNIAYDTVPFKVSALKLELFRVVQVKDLALESFYKGIDGKYHDVDMFVNSMAICPIEYAKYGFRINALKKGYKFEFEIDSRGFNDETDTIIIEPIFYSIKENARDAQEKEAYWYDSNKKVWKIGTGGHSNYERIILTNNNRSITGTKTATWRGEYFIPATTFLTTKGNTTTSAAANAIEGDIIVAFNIKGYKNGVERFDYNIKQWPKERTEIKAPYELGDVIRYGENSNLDDLKVYRMY